MGGSCTSPHGSRRARRSSPRPHRLCGTRPRPSSFAVKARWFVEWTGPARCTLHDVHRAGTLPCIENSDYRNTGERKRVTLAYRPANRPREGEIRTRSAQRGILAGTSVRHLAGRGRSHRPKQRGSRRPTMDVMSNGVHTPRYEPRRPRHCSVPDNPSSYGRFRH